jgi:uncharacterized membrane protein YdbT with pleckstrin-like domain
VSYIDETLMMDERVLYRTKPHWIIFTPSIGWLFLSFLLFLLGPTYALGRVYIYKNYMLTDVLGFITLIFALFSGLFSFINYQTSEFGITNRRILMKVGFISRLALEILLQKVESIQVYQTVFGRLFNYGSIIISGTGGSKDPFPNIPDPLTFRKYAQQQLEQMAKENP